MIRPKNIPSQADYKNKKSLNRQKIYYHNDYISWDNCRILRNLSILFKANTCIWVLSRMRLVILNTA